jgi:hypothetical protein
MIFSVIDLFSVFVWAASFNCGLKEGQEAGESGYLELRTKKWRYCVLNKLVVSVGTTAINYMYLFMTVTND